MWAVRCRIVKAPFNVYTLQYIGMGPSFSSHYVNWSIWMATSRRWPTAECFDGNWWQSSYQMESRSIQDGYCLMASSMRHTVGSSAPTARVQTTLSWAVCSTCLRDGRPPRGTWTSLRSLETSWVSTKPSTKSCTWLGATPGVNVAWGMNRLRAAVREGLVGAGGWEVGHDPEMCTRKPLLSWAASNAAWPAGQGKDSSLCSVLVRPAVLHPALGSQHQKGQNLSE